MTIHLAHRDVTMAVVSHAPYTQIEAFQKAQMGWRFHWVSAFRQQTSITTIMCRSRKRKSRPENWTTTTARLQISQVKKLRERVSLQKNTNGEIFHTYSTYARGLDILVGTYNFLDIAPKGRDEDGLKHSMAWVRHHDKYDGGYFVDPKQKYDQPQVAKAVSCCSGEDHG